jgi:hypothetical protein
MDNYQLYYKYLGRSNVYESYHEARKHEKSCDIGTIPCRIECTTCLCTTELTDEFLNPLDVRYPDHYQTCAYAKRISPAVLVEVSPFIHTNEECWTCVM